MGGALGDLQVPGELRDAVADAWRASARAEHASVGSFARFTMELMALGAPAQLLTLATAAQADEIRHAALAFEVASAVSGVPTGAGFWPLGAGFERVDVEAILTAAIVEGCVNETVSAQQVREAASLASSPILAARLAEVADDEARHAELSWAFVRWLLAERPDLAPVARAAFAQIPASEAVSDGPDLSAWGVLSPAASAAVAEQVVARVVRPAAAALLASIGEA
jgi:hypothetical protein